MTSSVPHSRFPALWVCPHPEGERQGGGMNLTSAGQCKPLRRLCPAVLYKQGLDSHRAGELLLVLRN